MAAKNRNEISPAFQWDFTHIYESDAAWEAACKEADACIDAISAHAGHLGDSADALLAALNAISSAAQKTEKAFIYANLKLSTDHGDPENQARNAKAEKMFVKFSTVCSFFEPEVLAIPEETLQTYMQDERLATYRQRMHNIARGRAHTLSAELENMLAALGDVAGNPSNTFTMFESVDMSFPDTIDENGNPAPLTHG
ncbi:MAG: hypothetical protein IKU17_05005, partial [Clostridia bacterium]|nr:hypothetical protein [Clostridia bacterium]